VTRETYRHALDTVLLPQGFTRSGDDWVRARGDMWECVNLQRSIGFGLTVNLLKADLATERLLESISSERSLIYPRMPTRLGTLATGYDRWWRNDPNGPKEAADLLIRYGLPWFEQVQMLEDQLEHWYQLGEGKGWYSAPSLIGRAITLYRLGRLDEALAVLRRPIPRTAIPGNVASVAALRAWMERQSSGCT
jgi:hypothetical protein